MKIINFMFLLNFALLGNEPIFNPPIVGKDYIFSNFSTKYSCSLKTDATHAIWGIYTQHGGGLDGTSLHLFPDGRYAIVQWSDIMPEEVVERGAFSYSNGIINLKPTATSTKENPSSWYLLGGCELPQKPGHRHINILADSKKWSTTGQTMNSDCALIKHHDYEDWGSLADGFNAADIKPTRFGLIMPPFPPAPPVLYRKPSKKKTK